MRHPRSSTSLSPTALRARQHRCAPTASEAALFAAIRGGRLGVTVRRQVALGRFIVDLLVPSARLVNEEDGGYPCTRRRADARRDRALERMGYRVLCIEAELVLSEVAKAVALVRAALAEPP